MASSFPGTMNPTALLFPAVERQAIDYSAIYTEHCHRIYSLAFWLTDNELLAEELSKNTFLRVFAGEQTEPHHVDRAFLTEVRENFAIGNLTLSVTPSQAQGVRANIKRVHLERAVVQLPATEKLIFLFHDVEGYAHERIARLLGISENESRNGLHQARLQVRELVAQEL
ncbi:MAG TPA: RNA polymerase sigma factor [Candidatus Angelobacter sp.]|nr:RNA polymerase sigma factor [Candidatus Angelobacter sp.]